MLNAVLPPTRQSVRDILAPFRAPTPRLALAVLLLDTAILAASWFAILAASHWFVQVLLAAANAVVIARLFIHGHDACHGSAFRKSWANQLAGRLALLPSLTPFSTWELGHNTLHHGFTNLRGKDYVYAPLTWAEYQALPPWRRALERAYRHPLGPGLCYAVEVWWKRLWFPTRRAVGALRPVYLFDSSSAAIYLALQVAVVLAVAPNPLQCLATAVILPQLFWNALMGFVTFQHHTHPSVTWYDNRHDWDPLDAQVSNTVHVEFPRLIGYLFGNIMEHTAHHVDVRIPMFRLPAAQRAIEELFPDSVPVQPWNWREYRNNCRVCQLYDYRNRRWLTFQGRPANIALPDQSTRRRRHADASSIEQSIEAANISALR